jgi:hypothetical protein
MSNVPSVFLLVGENASPFWGNSGIVFSIGARDFAISGEIGDGAVLRDPLVLPRFVAIYEVLDVFELGFEFIGKN